MNLIEQLGGYENAKKFINGECSDGFDVQELRDALLAYRRQHNIFEVGDKIVSTLDGGEFWMTVVCTIDAFHKKMAITNGCGHSIHHYDFRHATDLEIAAGHRL